MIRLFDTHFVRRGRELDGMWDFTAEGNPKKYQMPVPGCLEQHPDFMNFRGHVTYSKKITIGQTENVRLDFKGVSHTGDVFFDGKKVAHHYNAFTPFSTVIPNVEAGTHEIKVLVDNTFGEHSALHVPNDYYTYGGITRPVSMEFVPDVYIKRVHFTPGMQDGKWMATVEVVLENCSQKPVECSVETRLSADNGGAEKVEGAGKTAHNIIAAPENETTVVFQASYDKVQPWSHETPVLYYITALLKTDGKTVDDLIERVGFREVEISGKRILMNGKPLFIKGFNRHEDYAIVGCAIPLQLMVQDMDLMEAAGANAVRTCHYPNDERFLDLCDERGILVWEENHARSFGLERMQNPNFERQCEDCNREMIENHYNHPAIFIWGILNECASDTIEGRAMYQKQFEQIRSMDKSRPVTTATCRHFRDICLDLPDVVSYNMYSGWYQDVDTAERNQKELNWIEESGGSGKPIIISEFGAASIYGYRDRSRCKWSEERQYDIIVDNLEVYMNDPRISGVFVWQFADCRVTEGELFQSRARCHNNKGVVDEYRRPKEAYDAVSMLFHKYWLENDIHLNE